MTIKYRGYRLPPPVISFAVWAYHRIALSRQLSINRSWPFLRRDRTRLRALLTIVLLNAISSEVLATEGCEELTVTEIASGLTYPWGVAALPEGGFLVSQKSGKIVRIDSGSNRVESIDGVPPVYTLLDVALHPDFVASRRVFISYVAERDDALVVEVSTAILSGYALNNVTPVFHASPISKSPVNVGGRLEFLPDLTLLLTVGDQGRPANAQDLGSHQGAVIRINDDGTIPADNPFTQHKNALPEIFSIGHRNSQGLAVNASNGRIYASEHGPVGFDELNQIKPGGNYGWGNPRATQRSRKQELSAALHVWESAIAPSGIAAYSDELFNCWSGNLFVATLRGEHLRRITILDDRVVDEGPILTNRGRLRDVTVGADGALYILTDHVAGKLLRVAPTDQNCSCPK